MLLLHTFIDEFFNNAEVVTELSFVDVFIILSSKRFVFFPFGATKSNRSENVLCLQFSLRQNIFLVFNKRIACFIISPSSNNYKAKSLYYQLSLERTYLALTYIKRKILRNSEVLSFLLKEMLRQDRMTV